MAPNGSDVATQTISVSRPQQAAKPRATWIGHGWFHWPRRTWKECAVVVLLQVAICAKGGERPAVAEKLRLAGFNGDVWIARVHKLLSNERQEMPFSIQSKERSIDA